MICSSPPYPLWQDLRRNAAHAAAQLLYVRWHRFAVLLSRKESGAGRGLQQGHQRSSRVSVV